ncbi:hypothetical protein BDN72DRAFT_959870 [Pluteus cervinus]|uniref:Uncharacterized protein n=1 Tax=Pluteus cervinus TaxID=181527 RepID=A0ACD3AUN6_9AGAR|nr:hypothetical protein BDN72DRAFT_959870 [Pluteus cervinus]
MTMAILTTSLRAGIRLFRTPNLRIPVKVLKPVPIPSGLGTSNLRRSHVRHFAITSSQRIEDTTGARTEAKEEETKNKSKSGKEEEKQNERTSGRRLIHIESFFAGYAPKFQHIRTNHPSDEFKRLVEVYGWKPKEEARKKKGKNAEPLTEDEIKAKVADEMARKERDAAYKMAKEDYGKALIKQFGEIFGTDDQSLDSWMLLCEVLGVKTIPETLSQCKKKVRHKHANLVDLVHGAHIGEPVTTFPQYWKLIRYTRDEDKIFPKVEAKENRLLKALMRGIFEERSKKAGVSVPVVVGQKN